jgi:hypothetical protein
MAGQGIVRAPGAGAPLGMPPFWIRHEDPSFVVGRSSSVVRYFADDARVRAFEDDLRRMTYDANLVL